MGRDIDHVEGDYIAEGDVAGSVGGDEIGVDELWGRAGGQSEDEERAVGGWSERAETGDDQVGDKTGCFFRLWPYYEAPKTRSSVQRSRWRGG